MSNDKPQPQTTAGPMKMVVFLRPQGEDRILIPAGDDPEKHVHPSLILRVSSVPDELSTTEAWRTQSTEAPSSPIRARDVPDCYRTAFFGLRKALFESGRLTGNEADLWAWRIVHEERLVNQLP